MFTPDNATIDHPEAGRFDAHDRAMMRQVGVIVALPEEPSAPAHTVDMSLLTISARAEELRAKAHAMVDFPV